MPAPTNISFATATDLGTLPADVIQDVHDAGTTYTVFYKFTAPAGILVVGAFGFGDLTTYRPTVAVFDQAQLAYLGIAVQNKPVQFYVTPGQIYYLRFTTNAGNPTPAILTLNVQVAPQLTVPVGTIFVPDDANADGTVAGGFPAALVSHLNNYTTINFVNPFPSGEAGDVLASTGRILVSDEFVDFNFKLYDNQINFLANVASLGNGSPRIRACQGASIFYAGSVGGGGQNARVRTISNAGVLGGTTYDLGVAGLTALAAKNDETILYYSGAVSSVNSEIKRWDLVLNAAMSDLVADIGGTYQVTDILYLADDTIIVMYFQSSNGSVIIKNYNLSGTLLRTYDLGTGNSSTKPRLAYAIDDPDSFLAWTHASGTGESRFREIETSSGTVLGNVIQSEYEGGAYQSAETATPNSRSGPSFSCPFMVVRNAISVTNTDESLIVSGSEVIAEASGIYEMIKDKTDDTIWIDVDAGTEQDVKIP